MTTIPPLPEPGLQSPEDRRPRHPPGWWMGRRFIQLAREELAQGHRLQAGEKAWGAIAYNLKAIGQLRGWRHGSHRALENIGKQIVAEYESSELAIAISEANHIGHYNFYENQRNPETIADLIETVAEALQFEAPRPFAITSNQQRRLAELTGNDGLQVGDASPVGFSLRHRPGPASDGGPMVEPETP